MKKTMKILMGLMFLGATIANAQEQSTITDDKTKTETFKVWGICGMCETTIEKAANSVEGVTKADWNKETKMMEVSYDSTKTMNHKIYMAIANSGYDTEMHKASEEAYASIPGCCQYKREE